MNASLQLQNHRQRSNERRVELSLEISRVVCILSVGRSPSGSVNVAVLCVTVCDSVRNVFALTQRSQRRGSRGLEGSPPPKNICRRGLGMF